MHLLLVRHADAGDAEEFSRTGKSDDLRPLSEKGARQMKRVVPAVKALVPRCAVIASSPLVRAVQTADKLRRAYPRTRYEESHYLEPDAAPSETEKWLVTLRISDTAMLVGHEPHLGNLLEWLVAGSNSGALELKKAGACLIEFDAEVKKGEGCLLWLLGPRQLALVSARS